MKKPEVYFNPMGGSGILSIYFIEGGAEGPAIEADNLIGVGFFNSDGEIIEALFDEVNEKKDHQYLVFENHRVEIKVKDGKVSYKLMRKSPIRAIEYEKSKKKCGQ